MGKAVRWASYNGNALDAVGRVMGPTTMGEMVTVVEAEFDEAANRTRLGFAYGALVLVDGVWKPLAEASADEVLEAVRRG